MADNSRRDGRDDAEEIQRQLFDAYDEDDIDYLARLPLEVLLLKVLVHLDPTSLGRLMCTCRFLYSAAGSDLVWRPLTRERYKFVFSKYRGGWRFTFRDQLYKAKNSRVGMFGRTIAAPDKRWAKAKVASFQDGDRVVVGTSTVIPPSGWLDARTVTFGTVISTARGGMDVTVAIDHVTREVLRSNEREALQPTGDTPLVTRDIYGWVVENATAEPPTEPIAGAALDDESGFLAEVAELSFLSINLSRISERDYEMLVGQL